MFVTDLYLKKIKGDKTMNRSFVARLTRGTRMSAHFATKIKLTPCH